MWVCRQPFASKHGVGLSASDRYPPVERGLESLWSIFSRPTRVPSGTVSAEVAQQPLKGGRQRRSEPVKEMKELESVLQKLTVPSRCRDGPWWDRRSLAARRAQGLLRSKRLTVDDQPPRRQHTVKVMSARVGRGVARCESTSREHRQQVHHSAGPLRARRALLHDWRV